MCQNYWFFNLINDTKPVQCRARARAGPSDKVRPSTYSKNNVFLTNVFWRVYGAFTIYNAGKKQKLKIHIILIRLFALIRFFQSFYFVHLLPVTCAIIIWIGNCKFCVKIHAFHCLTNTLLWYILWVLWSKRLPFTYFCLTQT